MLRSFSLLALGLATLQAMAQAPSPRGPAAIQFKDMNGHSVQLAAPAQRTAAIPMPAGALYATVKQGTQGLVGLHPSTHHNLPSMLLPQIFPGIDKIRHDITNGNSFAPNVESLMQIQPDMVWQWGHMGDDLLNPLRAAGLNAAALRYGTEEQTQQWITLFAQSLGQPERGQRIIAWRQQVRSQLQQQLAKLPAAQRPKVMYLSRYKTGLAAAGQSGTFHSDVAIAGGVNVNTSKASAPSINIEQLLVWNPSVIVLSNFERDLTPETLYKNPLLADVDAVRHKRVYKAPSGGYYWDAPSQDSPLYWMWLAQLLHPDHVKVDLRAEVRKAYQLLYGFAITDAQMDHALHWKLNQGSRHYVRSFAPTHTAASR